MNERNQIQPDLEFITSLKKNGGSTIKKCMQCATCSVVCTLSNEDFGFPRKQLLMAQWGLKDRLLKDPGPWLCFYCGECTKKCPRKANPGEMMMSIRRYLTSFYDITGLSKLMYRSAYWELGILAALATAIILLFTIPDNFGFGLLNNSDSSAFSTVTMERFAPIDVVDWGDRIMAGVLGLLLLTNAARMFSMMTKDDKIPFRFYLSQVPFFIVQGITQKRWKECNESEATINWIRHLMLVIGYGTVFTLVVIFLPWFQVKDNSLHWTSFLGYYATVFLLTSTVWMIYDRLTKRTGMHEFSHLSDWLFPILLFLSALTGILLHIFRISDMPLQTYYTYMIHLAIVVPMLIVEVPFGKWGHLLYRPIALYVAAVKSKAAKELLAA
ncbi:MAG TPA: 4Fe-4S dicluster domain-containing protein [Ignavibacteriaceae bacterium]|nr:4Fe-4S dicluster domain-containing protein [Ignavibacteriaceae bacterium]